MKIRKILSVIGCLMLVASASYAQEKEEKKWDVMNPSGPSEKVSFTCEEGTWLNLDVSPDGKEIVFDLLGDIYTMPITGGDAKLLLGGHAFEVQPRYSPDGKNILFTSDREGADNIYYINRETSEIKAVTKETFRLLNNAVWMPDGKFVIGRKHFTGTRSAGAGEMWMYHLTGGDGFALTKRKNDQQDVNEPCISPDGKYLYYSEDVYPGGYFQYNKDPNNQIYVIKRYSFEDGETIVVASGGGSAFRPQISPDGKTLAFVRRVREKTVLFLKNLETEQEWPLTDQLSKDQCEAWAIFGVYTGFDWTPDGQHIVIWAQGKIHKIAVKDGADSIIPFKLQSSHTIMNAVERTGEVFTSEIDVKVIRSARTSPDGKTLVFSALGHLYAKELPNGTPKRITKGTDFEFEPSFSLDGETLYYVSWNDDTKGAIWSYKWRDTKASPKKITSEPAIYRTPVVSPDGTKIAYVKEGANEHQGYTYTNKPGLYLMNSNGSQSNLIHTYGENPQFSVNGDRVFFHIGGFLFGDLEKSINSVDLNGKDERVHVKSKYLNQYALSPDNTYLAFGELHNLYVTLLPPVGKTIDVSAESTTFPVARLTKDAGINIHWSKDGSKLHWTLGNRYFTDKVANRLPVNGIKAAEEAAMDTIGLEIGLKVPAHQPKGLLAFTHATIITMNGNEVLEDTDILVENNKIKAIGKGLNIPDGTQIIDAKGKTIMPGLIDVHAHIGDFRYGLSPQRNWMYYANLAFGITTAHDPSSNSEMIFSHSEMIRAGKMVGPRIFSTGTILYGADGDFKAVINSYEDALSSLRRTQAYGAFSVKSYNQPRRNQRQQVIQAARQLGMMVVPEGGSHFFHNMSMILDGHTGVEHNIPVAPLYSDVTQLWAKSKTANTPTLIVNYGGVNGEYYWYQNSNVWENERLMRFTPRTVIDTRARHRTMIPNEEYENGHILVSKSCKKLTDSGVRINVGGHGQLQGLGVHWEIWMLVQGGATPMEALRSATWNGARYLGMDKEIGSLKEGMLADFLVLDKNPLENIQNTEAIKYTSINGVIYEAETMKQIWPMSVEKGSFWFENQKYESRFPFHEETGTFGVQKCSCGSH